MFADDGKGLPEESNVTTSSGARESDRSRPGRTDGWDNSKSKQPRWDNDRNCDCGPELILAPLRRTPSQLAPMRDIRLYFPKPSNPEGPGVIVGNSIRLVSAVESGDALG